MPRIFLIGTSNEIPSLPYTALTGQDGGDACYPDIIGFLLNNTSSKIWWLQTIVLYYYSQAFCWQVVAADLGPDWIGCSWLGLFMHCLSAIWSARRWMV